MKLYPSFKKSFVHLLTLLIVFSCKHDNKPKQIITPIRIDSAIVENAPVQTQEEWQAELDSATKADNFKLKKLLQLVLQKANTKKNDKQFSNNLIEKNITYKGFSASYIFGNIFAKDKQHLLVKRFTGGSKFGTSLYSDIFLVENNMFKNVVKDTADIGYCGDTLIDVNADKNLDFVVSQYSGAGCCPRDARVAYLYNSSNGKFEVVNFFNPEFDDKNKLVYQYGYGHPGEVPMDKYKWVGYKLVQVESIYPDYAEGRRDSFVKPYRYIKTSFPSEKTKTIKEVPKEYKKLDMYKQYFIEYQD
jgi:hypothetical protein